MSIERLTSEPLSDRRLRVLVVGVDWPSRPFVDDLLLGLANLGVEIQLATGPRSARPPQIIRSRRTPATGRSLLSDPRGLAAILGSILRSPRASWRLAGIALNDEVPGRARLRMLLRCLPAARRAWDVIYMPWADSLNAYRALTGTGVPIVASCRGAQINVAQHDARRERSFRRMVRELQKISAVHCVSDDIARTVEALGVGSERLQVIRPGVDVRRFSPVREEPDRDTLRLITVGSLSWRKGQEFALLAVRLLMDRGVPAHLTVIGDGPDRQRLKHTVRDLGLNGRVTLAGRLDRGDVGQALRASSTYLLSSLSEGISNAVLEAMACGLPVVSTSCGGMNEAIAEGVEGFLVEPRDPVAMADRLQLLWNNPERRVAMGRAARDRVERDFDRDDQIRAFSALLRRVASPPTRPGARTSVA